MKYRPSAAATSSDSSRSTAARASGSTYSLFVFGDSLSDTGRLLAATGLPPSPPYFNGRISNGPVAVEQLADQLGLQISATNFAIAGAQTGRLNNNDTDTLKLGGLQDQIDQFKAQAAGLDAGPEDLYLIWAGANDFFIQPSNPIGTATAAVNNIKTAVSSLIQAGAKNIVVAQTPNLGRTPASLQAGLLEAGTQLSNLFNASLEATLDTIPEEANIILADLFTRTEAIAGDPARFGFTNITTPFLSGLTPAPAPADPNQFFFWDIFHPTTRAHALLTETFRSTSVTAITDDLTRRGTVAPERFVGYSGADLLQGLGGADQLVGNPGRDRLLGGAQNDSLSGGGNPDSLTGGAGQDSLTGGAGRDQFIYSNPSHGRDTILDFQVGKDQIDLRAILNRPGYDQPDRFAAYVRLRQRPSGTLVQVDGNGDRSGGFQPLALLSNVQPGDLTAASFRLGGSS
ncbi:MAG: SGNH/GDSL hydrolase family protein [Elainella sp.]